MTQWGFLPCRRHRGCVQFSNLSFPPMIVMEPRMFQNQFQVGAAWAKALGFDNGPRAAMGLRAHWYPVATGALMSWIRQYCEERKRGTGRNWRSAWASTSPPSLTRPVDCRWWARWRRPPEAITSGCALNLAGAIPILGKFAQTARNTRIAARMDALLSEIKVLNDWLTQSKNAIQRSRLAAEAGLAGVIKASVSAPNCCATRAGSAASIRKTGRRWAFCPRRSTFSATLRQQGYYIVIAPAIRSAWNG